MTRLPALNDWLRVIGVILLGSLFAMALAVAMLFAPIW
jgi:hypothetical protein